MRKRVLAGMLGLTMMMAMAMPVSAEESMQVEYTEPNDYMVTIPANVTLYKSEEQTISVTASKINIQPGKVLSVKVNSGITDGKVSLERASDTGTKATSTVSLSSGGAGIGDNAEIATFAENITTPASGGTLYFSALGNNVRAGSYTGTISFEMSIEQGGI